MTTTDEQLCLLAQRGDSTARDRLVARYINTVGMRARGYLSSTSEIEIEDLGQEGFIGLLGAISKYDASYGASFRTFAVLNIDRRMTDAVRAVFRKKQVPTSAKAEFDDAPGQDNPEHTAIVRDELERIMERIRLITSAKERRVLMMHLDGYSYSEIAARMGCSVKSIENALGRVRRKLCQ